MTRIRAVVAAVVALAAILLVAGASPAAAHTTNPWTGADTVCRASWCVNTGNLVRLWQSVLWADGFATGIDGQFGTDTHNKTVSWQSSKRNPSIGVDGEVGPQTWGRASNDSLVYDFSDQAGGFHRYHYGTGARSFEVREYFDGRWKFRNPSNGALLDTSHGS